MIKDSRNLFCKKMIMMILKRRRKHEKTTANQHRNERSVQSAYVNKLGRSKLKFSTFVCECNNNEVWSDLLKLCNILLCYSIFIDYSSFFFADATTRMPRRLGAVDHGASTSLSSCLHLCSCWHRLLWPSFGSSTSKVRHHVSYVKSSIYSIDRRKVEMRWHEWKLIFVIMSICTTIGGYTLEEDKKDELEKFFNLHPTLLIAGYITLSGFCKWNRLSSSCSESYPVFVSSDIFKWLIKLNWIQFIAILLYRICRCCSHLVVKLCHVFLHACTIPCVVIGGLVIWQYKERNDYVHFYSLHSWLGLATSGLFAFQFLIGFFR